MGNRTDRGDLGLLNKKERERNSTQKPQKFRILCVCLSAVFVILCAVGLGPLIYVSTQHHTKSSTTLGVVNNTVILGTFSSFFTSRVSVSECLHDNDYPQVNDISLARNSVQITHVTDVQLSLSLQYREFSSATTGLVDYLYLLEGSAIKHRICLGSPSNFVKHGKLFIIKGELDYAQYHRNTDNGEQLAVLSRDLEIGPHNQTVCVEVEYQVTETSYFFIMAKTPADILYSYETDIRSVYLKHDDFETLCVAGAPITCEIDLPGGFFSNEEFDLLAYIEVPIAVSPQTTHLCVTPQLSSKVLAIKIVSGVVLGVGLLSILVIVSLAFISRLKRSRRRGYVQIADIQGS